MADSLLQRIAEGDQAAVPECISRYGGLVWSLALRSCVGDRPEAEDASQEIFLDLWRNAHRFDPTRGSEETFVAMLARRRLIDRRRRLDRRPDCRALPPELPDRIDPDPVEQRDEADRALKALGELPEDRRRVLVLWIHHGMTHEEISRATGMPLGTVKTHARRGLIALRDRLAPTDSESEAAPEAGGVQP